MSIEIRELRPDEHAEGGRITAEAYRPYVRPGSQDWEDYLVEIADIAGRAPRTTILGAVDEDGTILGTLTLELEGRVDVEGHEGEPLPPDQAHIRMLGVAPQAQGRGVGKALMEASIEVARAAGKRLMTLNTTPRMKAAMAMYESMGFVRGPDTPVDYDIMLLSYSLRLD
jgi:ribosomal protein S18 acetylase RimI-like enzyme